MRSRRIIHLSDLHVGKSRKEARQTAKIIEWIADSYPRSTVLITGDVTESGTKKQFGATRSLLDQLAETNPILVVPGNHDYAWHGTFFNEDAWRDWIEFLGVPIGWRKPADPWMYSHARPKEWEGLGVWEDDWTVYFGIDSGDPTDEVHTARGYISEELAKRLKSKLRQHRGKVRIALLHHHPFTKGHWTKLKGAHHLMSAIEENCEILLFGHHHHYGIWWNKYGTVLTVASHKSTAPVVEDYLGVSVIKLAEETRGEVTFNHSIELIPR
jgi:predicted phosphodiesterase